MADRHFVASPASEKAPRETDLCPRVAVLIDYALGQSSGDNRQRVDEHLTHDDCSSCRGWVEKATRFCTEPMPNGSLPATPSPRASAPSVSDPTPIPTSSKFQRQAFRDLEERLRLLEEQ